MNKNLIYVLVGGFAIAIIFVFLLNMSAANSSDNGSISSGEDVAGVSGQNNDDTTTPTDVQDVDELSYEILQPGEGEIANNGDTLVVDYVGTLLDGTKFDSSIDRGTPFEFELGAGMVIQGWEEGVEGMKVGEVRKITIPSEKGYGETGSPPNIPGGAGLVFEVTLIEIK